MMTPQPPVLQVTGLKVRFRNRGTEVIAVDGMSYMVSAGRTLAIIGESGSGKTVSCRAVLGLLPDTAVVEGSVCLDGAELLGLGDKQMRAHRGTDLAIVFQDPSRSLDPTMRVGRQVAEAVRLHSRISRGKARRRAIELLRLVRLPAPDQRYDEYPHQLSGGMRQRVMIAIALSGQPKVLFADEATSALDVTTQAEIMELLTDLQAQFDMAMVLITHDLGLAMTYADEVLVVNAGKVVERRAVKTLLDDDCRPYTKLLLDAASQRRPEIYAVSPGLGPDVWPEAASAGTGAASRQASADGGPSEAKVLLQVRNVVQEFLASGSGRARNAVIQAVAGVSFEISDGETLSVVGESGSGKSTLARAIVQAPRPSAGQISIRGVELGALDRHGLRDQLRNVQLIFQSPYGSVNPSWKVSAIVEEPLRAFGVGDHSERRRHVAEVLDLVGLDPGTYGSRRPAQLSGGQLQQVAIARALTLSPALVICDEPASSLDALRQALVLDLLRRLRAELNLSYLLIAHDLSLVRQVSDRVAVMYLGKFCEIGPADVIYKTPAHPYTAALLAAAPRTDPAAPKVRREARLTGEPPSPIDPPSGCRFRTRCPRAASRCAETEPPMQTFGPGHQAACHFPLQTN